MTVGNLIYAKKLSNYEIDATGATAHWPDTTHYRATVPTGKRWFLFGGAGWRNVNAAATIRIRDVSGNMILFMAEHAAAQDTYFFPEAAEVGTTSFPFPMDEGDYVEVTFGVAQDAGSYGSALVLEVDL